MQAAEGKFNPKVHVEYDWNLRLEEMDESDDDLDDKVRHFTFVLVIFHPLKLEIFSLKAYTIMLILLAHSSLPQPSPIKKDRRPQSFCHSSSLSPHDKLSFPGFHGQRDKPRLSYGMFTNQVYSISTDCPSSPVSDAPPLPPRNAGKGKVGFKCALVKSHYMNSKNKNLYLFINDLWLPTDVFLTT